MCVCACTIVLVAENRSEENEANRSHEIALKEKETERLVEERKLIEAKIRLLEMGMHISLYASKIMCMYQLVSILSIVSFIVWIFNYDKGYIANHFKFFWG